MCNEKLLFIRNNPRVHEKKDFVGFFFVNLNSFERRRQRLCLNISHSPAKLFKPFLDSMKLSLECETLHSLHKQSKTKEKSFWFKQFSFVAANTCK